MSLSQSLSKEESIRFFTGLPNHAVLKGVFEHVSAGMNFIIKHQARPFPRVYDDSDEAQIEL